MGGDGKIWERESGKSRRERKGMEGREAKSKKGRDKIQFLRVYLWGLVSGVTSQRLLWGWPKDAQSVNS